MTRCTWWEYTGRYAQVNDHVSSPIMREIETGKECTSRYLPAGALWVAEGPYQKGYDGLSVCCRLPGGHTWMIDTRASNCTMPNDTEHRCWVRHGTVGETVHVDKAGKTCGAGSGSIMVPGYHGFLHHGELRQV